MKIVKVSLLLLFILLLCSVSYANEPRTALLIGNGAYRHFSKLTNPRPEAIEMKNALERLGFEVILILDASKEEMLDALYEFEEKLKTNGGIALFHYGGHGVQVDGENYLLPVDENIPDERRVRTRAINVDEVIGTMEVAGSDASIVILDACRDNPLPVGGRSGVRGLAVVGRKPKNSIIVYSAESGTVAKDGIFTPTLGC